MKKFIIVSLIIAFIVGIVSFFTQKSQITTNEVKRPEFNFNIEDFDIPKFDCSESKSNQYSYPPLYNEQYNTYNYGYNSFVYITQYGNCYHKPGCTHAKKSTGTMSRSTASSKGYSPCYYCFN